MKINIFEKGLEKYLTQEDLECFKQKRIGIGGAGGLGSNLSTILARCGFQHFEILDFDIIEASNLNRQFFFIDEVGNSKVETLKTRLLKINPDIEVVAHDIRWTPKNGEKFFKGCDFIVEAFDQAEEKRNFVEFYQDKADFIVSGNGVAGVLVKERIRTKRLGNIFFVGDGITESGGSRPPMAPRVTACAALMAEIILDLSLGRSLDSFGD